MGSSFFGSIYNRDPVAQTLGLHNPNQIGDARWIARPQYSGATPTLGDAMAGYGTNNLAPGQYAGAGQARDPNSVHPLAAPGSPGSSGFGSFSSGLGTAANTAKAGY